MDLNTQYISSTYAQRNFGEILDKSGIPVVILSDSKPKKVMLDFDEFVRMKKLEEKTKDDEFFAMLDKIHQRNAHIPYDEVVKDVDEALKYVRKRRPGY